MGESSANKYYVLAALAVLFLLFAVLANTSKTTDLTNEDIYFIWLEGDRLTRGENPYSRIHESDLRTNDKYATYFPLFYELSYLTNLAGLANFTVWVEFWRVAFLIFNLGIGLLIFLPFFRLGQYMAALFTVSFWLFNRWSLYVTAVVHLEFIAIFFFILSLVLLPKRKSAAFLLFGVSLGIKQIAVFTAPLYLIWAWQKAEDKPLRQMLNAGFLIGVVPLVSALPFIIWDFQGLIKSIMFSATRFPASHVRALSVDAYISLVGIPAKIPMLLFLLIVFGFTFKRRIGKYMAAFLTMIIFVEFNSVFFNQYMAWVMALLPLVLYEYLIRGEWREK